MERKYIIYQHTTPSGKVYIGQTCQKPEQRWRNGEGYLGCILFYNAIKKYGWGNIEHKILHTDLTKEKADILEKMYIQFFKRKNISLNLTDGGEGTAGRCVSEKTRKKMSNSRKGKIMSEYQRKKMSELLKGRVLTEEWRKKLSEKAKGRHLTEETKKKLSTAAKGRSLTEEWREKISESHKGYQFSEDAKRKMSESHKGKVHTEEQRKKISESKKGKRRKPFSDETRRKMSKPHKKLKRSIWLNEFKQEIEMADGPVKRFHKNWVKLRDL